jgi:D-lactate dehydrogenase (cytochrome)
MIDLANAAAAFAAPPATASTGAPMALLDALRHRFSLRFKLGRAMREQHGCEGSPSDTTAPDGVVFAHTTEEVAEVVRLCAMHRVAVTAFGAFSSLERHVLGHAGGISIDLSEMDEVLTINAQDMTATVQAGVTRSQLNAEVKDTGLFFPIDPGSKASLGGMAATRAGGTSAVRYGTMRENVMALTVVTAEGKIIRTARRAKKSSAGYDLTRIFVGSEGTLGIITEVTVRLYPRPEAIATAVCTFSDVRGAVDTVIQTIQTGVPLARAEFMDALALRAVNLHTETSFKERPTLFLEFHGTPAGVAEQAEAVHDIAREHGGDDYHWADQPEDRTRLWSARHTAFNACELLRPGWRTFTTDACVPLSRLAQCIEETIEDTRRSSLLCPLFGHVGDGHLLCLIIADPDNPVEMAEAERLNQRMMSRALRMEGTCTAEHGIGAQKVVLLTEEFDANAVHLMRQLKRAWDPLNILNPGKVIAIPA